MTHDGSLATTNTVVIKMLYNWNHNLFNHIIANFVSFENYLGETCPIILYVPYLECYILAALFKGTSVYEAIWPK